jgi:glycerol transport system ATP-binding protein
MTLILKDVVLEVGVKTHIYPTDLELPNTGFNILLGTTLAGKTTLMHLMAGLIKPTSGEIWFGGKNVTGVAVQKRNVSMVHQQFINYPNMTVFENIASPLRVIGMDKNKLNQRVESIADLLKMTPMLGRNPRELSGGQQQRTALARALVKDADLVLLDEPLANLDFKLREELREELPKIFENRGCCVVYATTEPMEALLLGGHTACLHQGRVTQFGKTDEIYRVPENLKSAQVFSDPPINTANITKQGDRIILNDAVSWPVGKKLQSMADGPYTLGIRPHHISPVQRQDNSVQVSGKVVITELSGSETTVHFNLDHLSWVSQAAGIHSFARDALIPFYLQTDRCLYFDSDQRLVEV